MAVFNQYCVKYKPGEPVKLRFFDFNMGEIKYITKYECKDYLVLPIYITRVGQCRQLKKIIIKHLTKQSKNVAPH